jgi:hypothetical protein
MKTNILILIMEILAVYWENSMNRVNIVTHRPIDRQRLGKHILAEPTLATIGRLLLENGSVNTPKTIWDNRRRRFPWSPPRGYVTSRFEGAVSCCR